MENNKLLQTLATILLGILFGYLIFGGTSKIDNSVERKHIISPVSTAYEITCTYPRILDTTYQEGVIKHTLPSKEKNPFVFTFSDLEEDVAKLKFIDSTQTISEVSLIKIFENDKRVVFIEGTGDSYFSVHTIFKNTGVSIYTKQASLLGIPFGTLSMGNCK